MRLGKRNLLTPTLLFNAFAAGRLKEFRIIKENTSLGAAGPPSLSEILGGHMAWKMLGRTFSQLRPIGNSNPSFSGTKTLDCMHARSFSPVFFFPVALV